MVHVRGIFAEKLTVCRAVNRHALEAVVAPMRAAYRDLGAEDHVFNVNFRAAKVVGRNPPEAEFFQAAAFFGVEIVGGHFVVGHVGLLRAFGVGRPVDWICIK